LNCLGKRGVFVSIGASSGPPPLLNVGTLNAKGSLYVTRPSLAAHATDVGEYGARAQDVIEAIQREVIKPFVWKSFSLDDVRLAHQQLESGHSNGSIILKP
jgi:NADPH2:quinone reductase